MKKARILRYPVESMTDADKTDDVTLLANTTTQAESLLHKLEQPAGSIGLYADANKREYMRFEQKWTIFTLSGRPLKLVHQFTYFGRNILSTESDVNVRLAKAWNAVDRLLTWRKSDISGKIKQDFFQAQTVPLLQ